MSKFKYLACVCFFLSVSNLTLAAVADNADNTGSATTTMQVKLTVKPGCDIQTVDPTLNLGTIADLGQAMSTTQLNSDSVKLNVNCTANSNPTISFDGGKNQGKASEAAGDRALADGTHYIPYQLYSDKDDKTVINVATPISLGSAQNNPGVESLSVFPKLPATNNPAYPGQYNDTVTITVSWTGSSKLTA